MWRPGWPLALFAWLGAAGAANRPTIDWPIVLPSGMHVTGGMVRGTLSSADEAPKRGTSAIVVSRSSATIPPLHFSIPTVTLGRMKSHCSGGGLFINSTIPLGPNDNISPAGTYCVFHSDSRTPMLASRSEKPIVLSSQNPAGRSDGALIDLPTGTADPVSPIEDEDFDLSKTTRLQLPQAGATGSDNSAYSPTDCTIPGEGGGTPGVLDGPLQELRPGAVGRVLGSRVDFTTSAEALVTFNAVRHASQFASSGTGVWDDPWVSPSGTGGVQEAISDCPSTGCHVIVDKGEYEISKAAWVRSNVWLSGDGIGISVLKRKANSLSNAQGPEFSRNPILSIGSAVDVPYTSASPGSSIGISDLTLDGNYENQLLTDIDLGAFGIYVAQTLGTENGGTVDGLTIQRVEVKNLMEDGIQVGPSRNVLVDSCVISNIGKTTAITSKNGITVGRGVADASAGWSTKVVISNNRIDGCGESVGGAGEGIATNGANNVTISYNDISHVVGGAGIELGASAGSVGYNLWVTGNTIHDLSAAAAHGAQGGIASAPAGVGRAVTITGNTIYNVPTDGIFISGTSGLTITGNTIYNAVTDTASRYLCGLCLVNDESAVIHGNTVVFPSAGSGVYGIALQGVTDSSFTGNTLLGHTASGINLTSGTQASTVRGNRIRGGLTGISIDSSGTNSGNCVFGNHPTEQTGAAYSDTSGQINYLDTLPDSDVKGRLLPPPSPPR